MSGRTRRLFLPLAVTEAQQIENAVQPQGGDRLLGGLLDQRFGAEGHTEAGQAKHRQVVGAVADRDGLLQLQALLLRQLAQQIGLALSIDDGLDSHPGDLAVLDLQFVGEYVVDTQPGLQLPGEIGKAAGENRGLVAQALEFGEQHLGPFGQAQRRTDLFQHVLGQALQQAQALLEAGTEIQLAAHGPLGDFGDLLTDSGGLGQLVDHLGLDQRRVHVEYRQTAIAAEHRVTLDGDVDIQFLGHAEELRTQRKRVSRLATYGELDAALALLGRHVQRHASGKAVDMIDVQPILGGNRADPLQLLGADLARQQSDYMTSLALAADPLPVVLFRDRGETHLLVQLVGSEQQILEHRLRAAVVRNLDEYAERQSVVDHRLADIEDVHPALS